MEEQLRVTEDQIAGLIDELARSKKLGRPLRDLPHVRALVEKSAHRMAAEGKPIEIIRLNLEGDLRWWHHHPEATAYPTPADRK